MNKVRSPLNFEKQRSKKTLLNDAVKTLDPSRFEVLHDISELNGKFGSQIAQPFAKKPRNTDIPGTVRNANHQKNGPDNDVFLDVNSNVGKRSLTLGMVELGK